MMNRKAILTSVSLVSSLLVLLALFSPALAQEGQVVERFDDPNLPGWEHSPEVIVADGALRVNPGNFAVRFGDWMDFTLNLRVRSTGPGEIQVSYHFREESRYNLHLWEDMILLERVEQETPSELGQAPLPAGQLSDWADLQVVVSGGSHQISLNGQVLINASDPQPLPPGSVFLHALGETVGEFDDLSITPAEGAPPPDEAPPEPAPVGVAEPLAQEPAPTQVAGIEGLVDDFFASQANNLELATFLINLLLAVVTSFVLSQVYVHWGTSLTNRRKFAANFMLVTVTTTFIILVVRSSVALSLGLVGALSIIRFRTAIKEPEELAYLFLAIGLGIGLGDNQRLITLLTLVVAILIIGLVRLFRRSQADVNLHLSVTSHNPDKVGMGAVMAALQRHCSKLRLLRYDENQEVLEMSFVVEFRGVSDLERARAALQELSERVEISFLDNKGIW